MLKRAFRASLGSNLTNLERDGRLWTSWLGLPYARIFTIRYAPIWYQANHRVNMGHDNIFCCSLTRFSIKYICIMFSLKLIRLILCFKDDFVQK